MPPTGADRLKGLLVAFGALLATSVVFGVLISFGLDGQGLTAAEAQWRFQAMVFVELADTFLVVVALMLLRQPGSGSASGVLPFPLSWVVGGVGLGLGLALNFSYHAALRGYLGLRPEQESILAVSGVTLPILLAYCVQPAVVEELFFRRLALETLRDVMGKHTAVFVSALMFGLAHIGVPLSIPVLVVLGVILGYARVVSGGLALPMLLHFAHNLVVLWANR